MVALLGLFDLPGHSQRKSCRAKVATPDFLLLVKVASGLLVKVFVLINVRCGRVSRVNLKSWSAFRRTLLVTHTKLPAELLAHVLHDDWM